MGLTWIWNDLQGTIRYAPSYESETFSPLTVFGPNGSAGDIGYHPTDGGRVYPATKVAMVLQAGMVHLGPMGKMHGQRDKVEVAGGDGGRGGNGKTGGDGKDATVSVGTAAMVDMAPLAVTDLMAAMVATDTLETALDMVLIIQRGTDGPDLYITVKPIYSPFYPDETLVYTEVVSRLNSSQSIENYIFHQDEPFVLPRTVDEAAMVDMADKVDTAVTVGAAVMVDAAVTAVMVETVVMAVRETVPMASLLDAQAKVEMVHVVATVATVATVEMVLPVAVVAMAVMVRGGDGGNIHIQVYGDTRFRERALPFSSALLVDKWGWWTSR